MKSFRYAVLCIAICASQQAFTQPAVQAQIERIVDECVRSPGANEPTATDTCRSVPFEIRQIVFQIPGFLPGDVDRYSYSIARFREKGGMGAGSVTPDEYGVLEKEVHLQTEPDIGKEYYYFYSVNRETDEMLFTLDLLDVRLDRLAESLGFSYQANLRAIASRGKILYGPGPGPRGRPFVNHEPAAAEIRLDISGENMTLDEIFDQIYRETNCTLRAEAEQLVLDSCG